MKEEYRVSNPLKIMFCLGLGLIFLYGLYLFSLTLETGYGFSKMAPLLICVACILFVINTVKSKVIISDTSVLQTNLFSKKELKMEDILGYRIGYRKIIIQPNKLEYPQLFLNDYIRTDGNQLLSQWVEKHLENLDKI